MNSGSSSSSHEHCLVSSSFSVTALFLCSSSHIRNFWSIFSVCLQSFNLTIHVFSCGYELTNHMMSHCISSPACWINVDSQLALLLCDCKLFPRWCRSKMWLQCLLLPLKMARCRSMASPSRPTLLISLAWRSGERVRLWVWDVRSSSTRRCTATSQKSSGTETASTLSVCVCWL